MKCKLVSIDEIKKGNPRMCLSSLRGLGRCFDCPQYVSKMGKPCDSRIVNNEYDSLKAEYEEIKQTNERRLKNIEKRIREIGLGGRMKCNKCGKEMIIGTADCRDMADEENFNYWKLDAHICVKCKYVFVEL